MSRRDWWLGILAVVVAILIHAAVPRYEYVHPGPTPVLRIDRWFGGVEYASSSGWRHWPPAS